MILNVKIIEMYTDEMAADEFHRYKSWDTCYEQFLAQQQNENHALHLAFYLASWGMYRGSGGILQKNHLIHQGAVDIFFSTKFQRLKCTPTNEVMEVYISDIMRLKKELSKHYGSISYKRGSEEPKPISTTDTLISKIMLGTFSCVPAYDAYFTRGLKDARFKHFNFDENSLKELFAFINRNKAAIDHCQTYIAEKTKAHHPIMKIIDMYFWELGFEAEKKDKDKKKEK